MPRNQDKQWAPRWCHRPHPLYESKHPALRGLLSLEHQLGLKERGIEWVPQGKLYKVGKLYLFHGKYVNEYHAKKHLSKFGASVCYGHTHVSQIHTNNQVKQRTHKAYGLACLCNKKASYLKGSIEGSWNNEFANLFIASNGDFNLFIVDVINNRFFVEGKSYK